MFVLKLSGIQIKFDCIIKNYLYFKGNYNAFL